jgi:carotenoid cleavage dioxygenase
MSRIDTAENSAHTPWHLRDNWEPMQVEITSTDLRVEGTIPPELDGLYVRTGPNPASGTSPHWFFGDGMLHGVRIRDGKAEWYRNQFVNTPSSASARKLPYDRVPELARGTGNTHVLPHNGSLLALEEGHWPFKIDGNLQTIGYENYDGALTCSMTAHPKICPVTGDLLAFSYFSFQPPYVHYIRIGADGKLKQLDPIDVPNMVMMHDFNVTQKNVIFMDLPLQFDLGEIASGIPFKFNRDAGARLGVMPRDGRGSDTRWFEIDPCYVFHPVNAYDDGDNIVIHVSRQNEAFGSSSDDYAEVGRLYKWTIDPISGKVTEEMVDDRPGDFGRVNDAYVGSKAQYAYLMSLGGEGNSEEPVYGSSLWKYDLSTGQCWEHHLGKTTRGGEPVFAPSSAAGAEDDGYVMTIVHDTATEKSRLIIIDAQNFTSPPLATIHLPQRVPYGAHGSWVPSGVISM